ncbi:MAG: M15 family metallopeptidase [Saccharofermentanales bacterium]
MGKYIKKYSYLALTMYITLMLCIVLSTACGQNTGNPDNSDISDKSGDSGSQTLSSGISISQTGGTPTVPPTAIPSATPGTASSSAVSVAATPTAPASTPAIKEVVIPAALMNLPKPANVSEVSQSQETEWMKYLTLFPDSTDCRMLLYFEQEKDSGLLIAMNQEKSDYQVEMLKVNKELIGNEWVMVPVKNTAKAAIPLTQQFRIVSPRVPLAKTQVNDTSKLTTFDIKSFGSPGKSPYRIRSVCIEPFMAMLDQSKKDGITATTVRDIYRSYSLQDLFFQSKIKEYQNAGLSYTAAKIKAETHTAAPGTSEHHDGFTADITTYQVDMVQKTGLTPLGNWLKNNCWDYGFIIRYLKGKEDQTTKIYEPWHVRYMGLPTSLFFKRYGIVLDEFHTYLKKNQYIITSFPGTSTAGGTADPTYIYIRCKSAADIMLVPEISDSETSLLSETGDGSVTLMQRVNP